MAKDAIAGIYATIDTFPTSASAQQARAAAALHPIHLKLLRGSVLNRLVIPRPLPPALYNSLRSTFCMC